MDTRSKAHLEHVKAIIRQYEEGVILSVEAVAAIYVASGDLCCTPQWQKEYTDVMAENSGHAREDDERAHYLSEC